MDSITFITTSALEWTPAATLRSTAHGRRTLNCTSAPSPTNCCTACSARWTYAFVRRVTTARAGHRGWRRAGASAHTQASYCSISTLTRGVRMWDEGEARRNGWERRRRRDASYEPSATSSERERLDRDNSGNSNRAGEAGRRSRR